MSEEYYLLVLFRVPFLRFSVPVRFGYFGQLIGGHGGFIGNKQIYII